mgnify:CR=1 FL=1
MPVLIVDREIDSLRSVINKMQTNITHAEGRLSLLIEFKKDGIKTVGKAVPNNQVYDDDI